MTLLSPSGLGLGLLVALLGALGACSKPDPQPDAAASGATEATTVAASASPTADSTASSAAASTAAPAIPEDEGPIRIVDLHVDTPYQVHFKERPSSLPEGHITPAAVKAGNYRALVFVIYIPDRLHGYKPRISDADEILGTIDKLVAEHETFQFAPLPGSPQAGTPPPPGVTQVYLGIEGAGAFAADIEQIDRFIERGVRVIGPVHHRDTKFSTSATGKGRLGLTKLGKKFCQRIYEKGALVDVSHMSDAAFADLIPIAEEAGAPIVATHSNARAVRKHPRNLKDAQLKVIAKTGGVAGLNLHRSYLRGTKSKLPDAVKHVMHMIDVAGIDHVAIGTDFDGGTPPKDLADASRLPALVEALREKGLSDEELRKLCSRNAVRVLGWQP